MDAIIRKAQLDLLAAFSAAATTFALAGGTALELFYLKHRFSRDLDFFSPKYDVKEIDRLISFLAEKNKAKIRLENEFLAPGRARVRFYSVKTKGAVAPLKIDFVEDVLIKKPRIKRFGRLPVYSAADIYLQKIMALTGTRLATDGIGREIVTGREEARDVFDIYYLSKKIKPLHLFVKKLVPQYQRGVIQWYRSYSRQEIKFGVHDLDVYDKKFDVSGMIGYLDKEIKQFMQEVI